MQIGDSSCTQNKTILQGGGYPSQMKSSCMHKWLTYLVVQREKIIIPCYGYGSHYNRYEHSQRTWAWNKRRPLPSRYVRSWTWDINVNSEPASEDMPIDGGRVVPPVFGLPRPIYQKKTTSLGMDLDHNATHFISSRTSCQRRHDWFRSS